MSSDLLPCPFCGSKLIDVSMTTEYDATGLYSRSRTFAITCNLCGARTAWFPDVLRAKEAWETRAGNEV